MTIEEIIRSDRTPEQIISDLKNKNVEVPAWAKLEKQYNPAKHPVNDVKTYKDRIRHGKVERMTRITYGIQKQACKRMKELMFTIPVKRIYKTTNDQEKKAAAIMEAIFDKNHINSVNLKRAHKVFASCEMATIWYAQEQDTVYAGEKSKLKLRCRNFSPMDNDELYPLFDEYDDMIALSIGYSRLEGMNRIYYFDTYTDNQHYRWKNAGTGWVADIEPETINIQKIQGIYIHRDEPIWEDQSENGQELEWTMSRQGNYLRKNSRPTWCIYSDTARPTSTDKEPSDDNIGRNVLHYGKDDRAEYATWPQATDALKFHTEELRRNIHTSLQLPDMSFEQMKATPMSGEARKMLFIDCQMKVTDESGDWLEFFDREVNVVRAFCKQMFPSLESVFDSLVVENVITPYQINDESQEIQDDTNATGGKAIASRRTAIRRLGWVPEEEIDNEIEQIDKEETATTNAFTNEPTE
jgi:hypothetical protein